MLVVNRDEVVRSLRGREGFVYSVMKCDGTEIGIRGRRDVLVG